MNKRTTRIVELVLLLLVLGVGGALVARLIWLQEPVVEQMRSDTPHARGVTITVPARPHSIREYVTDPTSVRRTVTFEVSTNSLGFRGPEPVRPKPSGRLRVVVAGECVAYGAGVAEGETYPRLLGELLAERHPDRDLEVINAGLATEPPELVLRLMKERALALDPDVVVFAPGAETSFLPCHTMGPPFRLWLERSEYDELLAGYRAQLGEALASSHEVGFELVLVTPTFTSFFFPDGQLWVDEMLAFADEHQLPALDTTALFQRAEARDGLVFEQLEGLQRVTRYQGGQGTVLLEVAFEAQDRHLAPEIERWLDDNPDLSQLTSLDGNHPNQHGHRLLAQELAALIERSGVLER